MGREEGGTIEVESPDNDARTRAAGSPWPDEEDSGTLGGRYAKGGKYRGSDSPSFYGGHGYNYGTNDGKRHLPRELYDDSDVEDILSWSGPEAEQLQEMLIAGGYLNPDHIVYYGQGRDPATVKAWKQALGDANVAQETWEVHLQTSIDNENMKADRDRAASAAPVRISLSNPQDLKDAFNTTAWDMLGTKLSEDQLNSMVGSWHERERSEQSADIEAEKGAGETAASTGEDTMFESTDPQSEEGGVAHAVYDVDPAGAEAMGFAKAHEHWLGQLAGPTNIGRQRGGNKMASPGGSI